MDQGGGGREYCKAQYWEDNQKLNLDYRLVTVLHQYFTNLYYSVEENSLVSENVQVLEDD